MATCEKCGGNYIFKGFVEDKKFICDDCGKKLSKKKGEESSPKK